MVAKVVSCSGNFRFISSDANPPPEAAAAAAMEGFVPDTSWYGVRLRGGGGGRLASGVGWGLRTWRWAVIDTWLRIFLSWPRALEGGPIEALRSCSGGFSSFSATWGKMVFLCVRGSHSTVWGKKCFFDCILLKLPNFLNVNHQVSRKMPYISWDVPFFIRYVSFLARGLVSRFPRMSLFFVSDEMHVVCYAVNLVSHISLNMSFLLRDVSRLSKDVSPFQRRTSRSLQELDMFCRRCFLHFTMNVAFSTRRVLFLNKCVFQ